MKRFYLLSVISLFSAGISAQEITGGERTLSADSIITSDARLDSIYQSLPEVMITGERPVVKASQGKLVYDLPQLIRDLPVDNAYDAVKELPGVTEMNGGLQLAGQGHRHSERKSDHPQRRTALHTVAEYPRKPDRKSRSDVQRTRPLPGARRTYQRATEANRGRSLFLAGRTLRQIQSEALRRF